jgi:hypothetical protein
MLNRRLIVGSHVSYHSSGQTQSMGRWYYYHGLLTCLVKASGMQHDKGNGFWIAIPAIMSELWVAIAVCGKKEWEVVVAGEDDGLAGEGSTGTGLVIAGDGVHCGRATGSALLAHGTEYIKDM